MGIELSRLIRLHTLGLIGRNCRLLDIGSSNLYSADPGSLLAFASDFGVTLSDNAVAAICEGSRYGPELTTNAMFVGDLLTRLGLDYLSIDVAKGFRTRILDLNRQNLPWRLRNSFDLVLNFGTSEHVLNQLNVFALIHAACKRGGYMVHEVPCSGWIDHGYFKYSPRFLFDLAGYNGYEVVAFEYGRGLPNDIYRPLENYSAYFPALKNASPVADSPDADLSACVIFRKTSSLPFVVPMETSTSVGAVRHPEASLLARAVLRVRQGLKSGRPRRTGRKG